ncbi:penicillin-binding transpeptidase domain-containing protein [Actinoplanes sp. G11-F43]|uniref:peptidoglycan D,D-transpeptidase FtsI family protein n=1 Tax=Actinoplanes sp. G11-F43 TaxID=3424130 RepID=UPI003D34C8FB
MTGDEPGDGREVRRGRTSIGDARAYTPRGRTVAERGRVPRDSGRNADPFRPALQVLDGGDGAPRATRGRGRATEQPPAQRDSEQPRARSRAKETDEPRTRGRAKDSDEPRTRGRAKDTGEPRGRGKARETAEPRSRSTARDREDGRTRDSLARDSLARDSRARESRPNRETRERRDDRERRSGRRERPESPSGGRRVTDRGRGPSPRTAKERRPVPAEPPKLANSNRRLRLGTVLALSLFVTIGVRLVVLQVATSPAEAASLIELREKRLSSVTLPAPRGSILDRNGNVLAHSVEARYVYVDPENLELQKDIPGTAAKLAPLLGVAQSELVADMQRTKLVEGWLKFRYLARGVNVAVADKIDALKLPGIYTHLDERRDVPGRDLASNLIGFTGAGDEQRGLEGLEARYDDLLHGTDGKRVFEVGAGKGLSNKPIPGGFQQDTAARPGSSLQLTIDQDIQYEVQRVLDAEAKKRSATIAGAVVLDVRTGEVLAQASYPSYNAANWQKVKSSDRIDVPSSVVTDPGSTHKAFIFGAALQEGLTQPDELITIGRGIKKGDTTFTDTHPQDNGTRMTLPGLLAYSSNVGTILLADRLGKEKVYQYQQKFGLGQATGEGMPGEASGQLLKPEDWSGSSHGSVPIGHSVAATLIQMAAGYGAIANDGVYIQPHLIKATISGEDGEVTPATAPRTHKVLDPEVAAQLRLMMEAVIDVKDGTGKAAAVNGYRVAGKTGTGDLLIEGQYTSHDAGSFVGMAPAEDPRFVIAVTMDTSKGGGGVVAAPAFSEMMSYTLRHNHVPPSGSTPPTFKIKE